MKMIMPFEENWRVFPDILSCLGLEKEGAPVISVVGAGGKTSVVEAIGRAYKSRGRNAVITTTAHMFYPGDEWELTGENLEELQKKLKKNKVVWIGKLWGKGKIQGVSPAFLKEVISLKIPLIIEADGARRLPFKVPGEREPVILRESSLVIGVLGMDALGHPIEEVSFRSALTARLLLKEENDRIEEGDYIKVIESRDGLRKGITDKMEFKIILNKVDDTEREKSGRRIREELYKKGISQVYLVQLEPERKRTNG